MKTYNLFISHSWRYSTTYDSLIGLLNNRQFFAFKDYSVPKDDPIHDAANTQELREAIRSQMSSCHVVIIMAGVYSTYSKWINEEIDLAANAFLEAKPILAVRPWGNELLSVPVQNAADKIVGWNTESIVGAIRELA